MGNTGDAGTEPVNNPDSFEPDTFGLDEQLSDNAKSEGWVWRTSTGRPDLGVEAAMRRATMKARRRAIALTGRVVTIRNGKVEYDTEP